MTPQFPLFSEDAKRCLVLGGSKGLGKAISHLLHVEAYRVFTAARKNADIELDLRSSPDEIKTVVEEAIHQLGGLDYLIVSSGMGAFEKPLVGAEKVQDLFQVNVLGPLVAYRACLKALLKSKGTCCFITSTAARKPGSGGLSYYAATKGAINSFVTSEARRLAKKGVALFAVAPGYFESEMTADLVPALREAITKAIPFGRFGEANEIAHFVVALLKQSPWTLSGSIYEASGGA